MKSEHSNLTFQPTLVTLEDIVSVSKDKQRASLMKTVTVASGQTFQLNVKFTIHELLVHPLGHGAILIRMLAITQEQRLSNCYDLAILHSALKDVDPSAPYRSCFLCLIGDNYMMHYRKSQRLEYLITAVEAHKQALQGALSNDTGVSL